MLPSRKHTRKHCTKELPLGLQILIPLNL
uniref:Uncharacterized protein n=1 Tax=Anguilla anguilla TaxID=7936 RepID=A0A0E9SK45_ANGAN